MNADLMASAALQLATIVTAVWSLTEFLGKAIDRRRQKKAAGEIPPRTPPRARKALIAVALGPAMALVGYVTGFVTAIPLTGWKGYLGAAFAGLVATLVAKQFHDLVAAPLMNRLRRPGAGPGDGGGK